MWQHRRTGGMVIAGLLGLALVAAARGGRADDLSLFSSFLPLHGPPCGELPALPRPDAPCTAAGGRVSTVDSLTENLGPAWTGAWSGDGCFQDVRSAVSGPAQSTRLEDLPPALAEIRAAAAGSWSLDGGDPDHDAPPSPDTQPDLEAAPPLLPVAPAAPDLRALLATAALPAVGLIRRRRYRIAGFVSERLTTALGLLLVILWGSLRRG